MAEYIEREAVLMKLMQDGCSAKNLQSISDIPGADVAPVVHGKDLAQPSLFKCSVCGCEDDDTYTCDVSEYRFCPACGARLTKKQNLSHP